MGEASRVRGPEDGKWWEKGNCGQKKVGKTEGEVLSRPAQGRRTWPESPWGFLFLAGNLQRGYTVGVVVLGETDIGQNTDLGSIPAGVV